MHLLSQVLSIAEISVMLLLLSSLLSLLVGCDSTSEHNFPFLALGTKLISYDIAHIYNDKKCVTSCTHANKVIFLNSLR